jgi:8-amino-7-oxononanoate synthase
MDGDFPNLPEFIAVKNKHQALLMVDEAHSLGVLGKNGGGIREHYQLQGKDIDIWMGTLSKTLAGCGGYIAGASALVENLKYAAPGFLYSVGIAPPLAAASLQALKLLHQEPERVHRLTTNGQLFLNLCQQAKINIGLSKGLSVIPAITGSSARAGMLANSLFDAGINVQPIFYPAVEENAARLRFFMSSEHTQEQLRYTVDTLAKHLKHYD